jgi:hypothetical protein
MYLPWRNDKTLQNVQAHYRYAGHGPGTVKFATDKSSAGTHASRYVTRPPMSRA